MKKLLGVFIIPFFLLGCSTSKVISSNNDNNLVARDKYNNSEVTLSTSKINVLVGGVNKISVESEYGITWYIDDNELVSIEYLERDEYQITGLKEGKTIIRALSLNGKSSFCEVNVLKKEDIKTLDDIYSLEVNGKESLNFTTLYVVENNNGIIKYVEDLYEHTISKPNPFFSAVELHFSNGINSRYSNEYELLGYNNQVSLPSSLEYGDIIICHHNYSSERASLPAYLNVYNLFDINLFTNQTLEYQDYNY